MKTTIRAVAALVLSTCVLSAQPQAIPKEPVRFPPGQNQATIKNTIKGRQAIDYIVTASQGQRLSVSFKARNTSAYFNVFVSGEPTGIFNGSMKGDHFEDLLLKDGDYVIRVYLMRNAAQRNETADFTLTVALSAEPKSDAGGRRAAPFDRTLKLQGITFRVVSTNDSDRPTVTITPSGLETDNRVITREASGHVVEAEVGDLNADRSPEVYVYVRGTDTSASGSLIAYAANRRKSLSEIFLPPVPAAGYRGRDEMRLVESSLVRRFPVYRDGDADDKPTGGIRQIQYKLGSGEAGWRLRVDRVVN